MYLIGQHVGCQDLLDAINQRNSLRVVVFGHVHNDYGFDNKADKWFINASQCNGLYRGDYKNQPIQFSMDKYTKKVLDPPTVCLDIQTKEIRPQGNLYDDRSEQRTLNKTAMVMNNQHNRYGQQIYSPYTNQHNDGFTTHETVHNQDHSSNNYV